MGTAACSEDAAPPLDVPWEPHPWPPVPFVCNGRSAPAGAHSGDPRPSGSRPRGTLGSRGAFAPAQAPKAALSSDTAVRPPLPSRASGTLRDTQPLPSPACFERKHTPRDTRVPRTPTWSAVSVGTDGSWGEWGWPRGSRSQGGPLHQPEAGRLPPAPPPGINHPAIAFDGPGV